MMYGCLWCRAPLITAVGSGGSSDTNTSHTLFRGGKEGDAYIVGDVVLSCVWVWISSVWYKQWGGSVHCDMP